MIKISDGIIAITRGDDATITVSITNDIGEPYEFQEGDTLIMTVRKVPDETSPIIFQTTSSNTTLIINHNDTANADVGKYSADIQLISGNKIVTVFPNLEGDSRYKIKSFNNFIIMPEVTI